MGSNDEIICRTFEPKRVSRAEFEALKRFGDYEELSDGNLMRMEGDKEFRIYCEGFSIRVVTRGFGDALAEVHERVMERSRKAPTYLDRLQAEFEKRVL